MSKATVRGSERPAGGKDDTAHAEHHPSPRSRLRRSGHAQKSGEEADPGGHLRPLAFNDEATKISIGVAAASSPTIDRGPEDRSQRSAIAIQTNPMETAASPSLPSLMASTGLSATRARAPDTR